MIATILPSSGNFHAVLYNEKKVSQGKATLLDIRNIPFISELGSYEPEDLQKYLISYSARNTRIRKPQFHIAISCKGHEYTAQELVEFANQYLERMGYDINTMPMAIYAHHDTDNTHIHIVTSRVAPDGHKIEHSHERRRSQTIVAELENRDYILEKDSAISEALEYDFASPQQFCAILSASGYDSKIEDDTDKVMLYKHGSSQGEVPLSEINARLNQRNTSEADKLDRKKRLRQIKSCVKKYQAMSADRQELQSLLKRKFGIDLVFYGKTDKPYGYALIDHSTKRVYAGKEILPVKRLLDFSTPQNNHADILDFIKQRLDQDKFAGTADINKALTKKYGRYYLKGKKLRKFKSDEVRDLPPEIKAKISRNDKLAFAASFAPANDNEIAVLSKYFHLPELKQYIDNTGAANRAQGHMRIAVLTHLLGTSGNSTLNSDLSKAGFAVRKDNGSTYIIDVRGRAISNADGLSPNLSNRLQVSPRRQSGGGGGVAPDNRSTHNKSRSRINTSGLDEGSHSFSREWEVGQTPYENNSDIKLH